MGRLLAALCALLMLAGPVWAVEQTPYGAYTPGAAMISPYYGIYVPVSGASPFVPTPLVPQPAAFFTADNNLAGSQNNYLIMGTGAGLPPATPTLTHTLSLNFRYDDNAWPLLRVTTTGFTLISNCSASNCTSGTREWITISKPGVNTTTDARNAEIQFSMLKNNFQAWNSPVSGGTNFTGINVYPNKAYCLAVTSFGTDADPSLKGKIGLTLIDATGAVVGSSLGTGDNMDSTQAGFYYSAAGVARSQAALGDDWVTIGTLRWPATTTVLSGTAGPLGNVMNTWGVPANTAGVINTSTMQNICGWGGRDPVTAETVEGLTIQSLYRLNDAGVWAGDPAGQITTAATPAAGSNITAAAPLLPSPCLTLDNEGAANFFSVDLGQSGVNASGKVYLRGTVSAAACGGTPSGVQARVLNSSGTDLTGWQDLTLAGSSYSGSISGIKAGGPYFRQTRITNAPTYVLADATPNWMGLKLIDIGQSQQNVKYNPQNLGSTGTGQSLSLAGETLSVIWWNALGGTTPGPGSSDRMNVGHAQFLMLSAANTPGNQTGQVGDGIVQRGKTLSALSGGWPVQAIDIAVSGESANGWAMDYTPAQETLSGSGVGPYIGPDGSNSLQPTFNIPGATGIKPAIGAILPGSLKLYDTSGTRQIAHDDGAGGLVGDSGFTISGTPTLVYERTGAALTPAVYPALSVTFTSAPSGAVTAQWTSLQDSDKAAAAPHSYFSGFTTFGDGVNPGTGLSTNVLSRLVGPPTAFMFEQCTSDSGTVSSPFGNSAGEALLGAKWDYTFGTKMNFFWWNSSSIPIIATGYPRNTSAGGGSGSAQGNNAGCQSFMLNYGARGGRYYNGGTYQDLTMQTSNNRGGPHANSSPFGGLRQGMREAYYVWGVQSGNQLQEPTITGAAFKNTGTVDYSRIVVSFNLPQGTSLNTCGTNLSNGTYPETGTCTFSGVGAVTRAFTVITGASFAVGVGVYSGYDGLNMRDLTLTPSLGFSCVIATATTVECTKASGSWTSGQAWIQYAAGAWGVRAGGAFSYTITGAGSGYTDGTYSVGVAGTGCAQTPQLSIVVSGGSIISATPISAGSGCSAATVPLTALGGGSGGAITANLAPSSADSDDVGTLLYDNSGGYGTNAPGHTVRQVITPVAVAG